MVVKQIFNTEQFLTSLEKVTSIDDSTSQTFEHNIDVIAEPTESVPDSITHVTRQTQGNFMSKNNALQETNLTEENTNTNKEYLSLQQESQLGVIIKSQNSDLSELMIREEINDKEDLPHYQKSLLGIESLKLNQNELMTTESITQKKRHCPAKKSMDFLWN